MDLYRGVYAADGKNRPGVMAWAIPGRETRGYVGVSRCLVGKTERDGGNPIEHGHMTTHVYGLDSTHVYGQV